MSKNLTRKGLALGAVVALATTLFSGAPALAGVNDGTVTIKPTSGTSYNVLLGTNFALDVNYSSGLAVTGAVLSALVEDASGQAKASFTQGTDTATATTTRTYTSGATVVQSTTTADATRAATADTLRLSLPSSVATTTPVKVTAWYDSNADKIIDANEKVSATVTVNFYATSGVTWATAIDQPVLGATSVVARITPSPALNGQQIGDADTLVTADFGSSVTADVTQNVTRTYSYNADDAYWTVTSGLLTATVASATYSAQAKVAGELVGTRVYTSVETVVTSASVGRFVASSDVEGTSATAAAIRASARTFVFEVEATKSSGATVPAGIPVAATFNLTGASAWTGKVSINGVEKSTVLASSATSIRVIANTNASGVATFTVKAPEDVIATDALKITWDAIQGSSGTGGNALATWTAVEYSAYEVTKHSSNLTVSTVSGSATSIPVKVVDQWGQPLTAANYYVQATATGRTAATTYTAISNGLATVSIADAALTTGDTTVAFDIYKNISGTYTQVTNSTFAAETTVDADNSNGIQAGSYTIKYVAASQTYTNTFGSSLTLTGTVDVDRLAAVDTEIDNLSAPVAGTGFVTITGTIKNATTGSTTGGALVSVSGAGLLFEVAGKFSLDSATFYAANDGSYSFKIHANKATTGTVVTVSANGVSGTKTVVFTSTLAAKALVLTVPAYATAGTAVDVVATVTDKWGNGVSTSGLTLSSTGAGYLNATGSATTITSGVVRAKLILGAAETGTAVVTAETTTATGGLTDASARTVKATLTIGTAPAAAGSATAAVAGSTGKFYVSVTDAAAKKVVIKVAGKFVKSFTGTAAKKTVVTKSTKGSKKVTVFVGGKLVATKTVTVK